MGRCAARIFPSLAGEAGVAGERDLAARQRRVLDLGKNHSPNIDKTAEAETIVTWPVLRLGGTNRYNPPWRRDA